MDFWGDFEVMCNFCGSRFWFGVEGCGKVFGKFKKVEKL